MSRLTGPREDLTGQTFTHWSVLRLGSRKNREWYWVCRCECGTEKEVRGADLRHSRSTGCIHCYPNRTLGKSSHRWKGVGDMPGSWWSILERSARDRDILVFVTPLEAWGLFQKQEGVCALSGVSIDFDKPITASLDRIDSEKPYELVNLQWVHKDVNLMKNKFSQDYFIEMCKRISESRT